MMIIGYFNIIIIIAVFKVVKVKISWCNTNCG